MLDQNTDRMWFVIGAVIVGAAIIFIANGTLPTLFASVSDSFEESANKGTEVISEIGPNVAINLIPKNRPVVGRWVDPSSGHLRSDNNGDQWTTYEEIPVEVGQKYIFEMPRKVENMRVTYFNSAGGKVTGHFLGQYPTEFITTAPTGSVTATISSKHSEIPVGEWWFGEYRE